MIKACGKRVIVQLVEQDVPKRESVLILPDADKCLTGVVISTGCEVDDGLWNGDKVYFDETAGLEIMIQGEQYIVLHENNILAAYREEIDL